MPRLLKFIGFFLAVTLAMLGGIYLINKQAVDTAFKNDLSDGTEFVPMTYSLKGLVEYIQAQPQDISLVSLRGSDPDSHFVVNAETSRSLGNMANTLLLAAYTSAVHAGTVDRTETVDMDILAALHVTGYDDSGFRRAQTALSDQGNPTLDDLALMLAETNTPALADYLYLKLGHETISQLPAALALEHTHAPLPWAGLLIGWDPRAMGIPFEALDRKYSAMDPATYHKTITNIGTRFLASATYRDSITAALNKGDKLLFSEQKRRNAMATRGQPLEIVTFLATPNDSLFAAPAREHLRELLSWPMKNPRTAHEFQQYGAIYDSKMSYLGGIDFGIPQHGGEPITQIFIMENIPVGLFLHLSSNLMTQDFQQRLIWDPDLIRLVRKELTP